MLEKTIYFRQTDRLCMRDWLESFLKDTDTVKLCKNVAKYFATKQDVIGS